MFINRIELTNWKNFARVRVDCGMRVFVIGPNAAGKSNFLDALRFLKDVADHGLGKAVNDRRGGMKSVRYVNARRQPEVTVAVEIDHHWRYELSFGGQKNDGPFVTREVVEKTEDGETSIILDRPDADDREDPPRLRQTALEQTNANKHFREVAEFFSTMQYRHILPQLVREPAAFSPNPVTNDPYGRDLVYTIWKTPEKTRKARLKRINEALKVAVPNMQGLSVVQNKNGIPHFQVKYKHWRKNNVFESEAAFSDGTLRLLALLWSLLDSSGPLLLEEPELSLNEEIVSRLPGLFTSVDKGKKKAGRQIFVTTHAHALLRDPGIGPDEILILVPDDAGVAIRSPHVQEKKAMVEGQLTAADVLLPATNPVDANQLGLF
ncbi:MAG: AAA family ATPase [Planctomycetes bacterium]|nr:AAA family ATPase [Planctomycetota bacterium]